MNGIQSITPFEIKTRLSKGDPLNIIDVREYEEVAQGMIPGAQHIPLGELPNRWEEIRQTPEIILVCRSGSRSSKACNYLILQGVQGITNMEGGMLEWESGD